MLIMLTNKLTGYTDEELKQICEKLRLPINGIFMKDELNTQNLTNGNYIMNLQNHNQNGSHWVAFVKKDNIIVYCDTYGQPPPQNEVILFKKQHDFVYYNKVQIQDYNSTLCGLYAILFLFCATFDKAHVLPRRNDSFLDGFIKNKKKLKQNDNRILYYLNNLLT